MIGFPALAATSMDQGRLAAYHAFGEPARELQSLQPIGIYTVPEISYCGKTEAELTKEAVPYEVGLSRYRELARGAIVGDSYGMLKLLVSTEDRTLLGVHVFGTNATDLVHIGQAIMGCGGTVNYLVDTVLNYPTLSEAYKVAALDATNKIRAVNMFVTGSPDRSPVPDEPMAPASPPRLVADPVPVEPRARVDDGARGGPHLHVQVRAGRVAAVAHLGDLLAGGHLFAHRDQRAVDVPVRGDRAVVVAHPDPQPETAGRAGGDHLTGQRGADGGADRGGDVDAVVAVAPPRAESGADPPGDHLHVARRGHLGYGLPARR